MNKQDRIIKFRGLTTEGLWKFGYLIKQGAYYFIQNDRGGNTPVMENTISQFTGLFDKEGKEIYEGDIFRVEEDAGGLIYYLVIVWVQEWCMFCTLNTGEYKRYLIEGITALDEPMFWTYTLEDTNDRRFFLCGNIHQNPELLTK